jgi:hypothetical protein
MRNVPKIVQARLQRQGPQVAKGHPDADLLTAFAEQSLAESERERVIEHLARCGDCREVVALVQPVTELGTTASSVRAAGSAWLSWTVLRWAVVAAGVVLVTSVGILQYRQRTQQNASVVSARIGHEEKVATALQSSQPSVEKPVVRGNIPQALENAKQTPTRKLSGAQSALTANHLAPSPNPILPPSTVMNQTGSGGGTGGGVFRGVGSGLGQADKNKKVQAKSDSLELEPTARGAAFATTPENSTARSAPSAPVPQVAVSGAAQTVELQSESAAVAARSQGQVAQNYAERPSQNQGLNNLDVVKAKDSVPGESQASAVAAPNVSTSNVAMLKALRLSARWGISSDGVLQRSFDAGKTWEGVNIGERMESTVELRDQGREKKLQKKERGPAFVFLAVAALGTDVWAGGSRAMLYHSPDSGAHWARVLPAEANKALTGDVVSLEFPDPQHGRVATSSGEVWLTSDDGQTWHKQQ